MTEFSQTFIIDGDKVECLYTEVEGLDVRKLGRIKKAKKISDVKFHAGEQQWHAIDRKTGKIIARDPSRSECVRKEHQYYEREIAEGRIPWE